MKRPLDRSAVIVPALVAIWSLAFRGFEGGRWSDIPIIKSFADPRLYVRDPFVYSLHDGTPAAYSYQSIQSAARLAAGGRRAARASPRKRAAPAAQPGRRPRRLPYSR